MKKFLLIGAITAMSIVSLGNVAHAHHDHDEKVINITSFEGKYHIKGFCNTHTFDSNNMTVTKDNDIEGTFSSSTEDLSLTGWVKVEKNGEVYFYGDGSYVGAEFRGSVVDWKKGIFKGKVDTSGEVYCTGEWTMRKIK